LLITFFAFFLMPGWISKWFDLSFFDEKATLFFVKFMQQSIEQRRQDNVKRNDLIDLALQEPKDKNPETSSNSNGNYPVESGSSPEKCLTPDELQDIVIGNALMMFIAGYDTVSSSASVMLYHLAKNQEAQQKVYQEISDAIIENSGQEILDYGTITALPYLDMVYLESLRCYSGSVILRVANNDYQIPGTEITILKDTAVRIPMPAIMKDEKYFPNPEIFNPENFHPDRIAERHRYSYGGFGHGPRNCIAQRFAEVEVKIVISRILTNFKILPCEQTVEQLIPDPKSRAFQPKGGILFTVEKR